LTLSDQHTRYLLMCEALARPDEAGVRIHLERAFREFGLPDRIRSDNGTPFASAAIGGLSSLSVWWIKLGVYPERTRPAHPQDNGRHERMHRTLKDEATWPPRANLADQQLSLDYFRHVYNDLSTARSVGDEDASVVVFTFGQTHAGGPQVARISRWDGGPQARC
jgi:transposase InsO family protein